MDHSRTSPAGSPLLNRDGVVIGGPKVPFGLYKVFIAAVTLAASSAGVRGSQSWISGYEYPNGCVKREDVDV